MHRITTLIAGLTLFVSVTTAHAEQHWTRCVLRFGLKGGFSSKTCSHFAIHRPHGFRIGHFWHETHHPVPRGSVSVRITYPRFAPRYSLPGCPPAIARWAALIIPAAHQYGLPVPVMTGVMAIESGGNPAALNPSGAAGLYQFMPSTATAIGINPYDPVQAVWAAARYIHDYGVVGFSGGGYSSAWGCD